MVGLGQLSIYYPLNSCFYFVYVSVWPPRENVSNVKKNVNYMKNKIQNEDIRDIWNMDPGCYDLAMESFYRNKYKIVLLGEEEFELRVSNLVLGVVLGL